MYIEEILLKKIEKLIGTKKLVFETNDKRYAFCLRTKTVRITDMVSIYYSNSEQSHFGGSCEKVCIELLSRIIENLEEHIELLEKATEISEEIKEYQDEKNKYYISIGKIFQISKKDYEVTKKTITEEGYIL